MQKYNDTYREFSTVIGRIFTKIAINKGLIGQYFISLTTIIADDLFYLYTEYNEAVK